MAGDALTIARPYAEAVFARADETATLDQWSEMVELLAAAVQDAVVTSAISNPLFEQADLLELMLDIGGDHLSEEGQNMVRMLVQNGRLSVMPEIATIYEKLKAERQRTMSVHVRSAFELQPAQEQQVVDALKRKLGLDVTITSEQDPELIGGVLIQAGDLVIDGTIKGKIAQLMNELGI